MIPLKGALRHFKDTFCHEYRDLGFILGFLGFNILPIILSLLRDQGHLLGFKCPQYLRSH